MTELLRVTPAFIHDELVNNLDQNMMNQAIYQQQLSTGYTVNQPSDAPGQIAAILQQKALVQRTDQYVANANDGTAFLGVADNAINIALQQADQLKSLVVSIPTVAATGEPVALQGIINQIANLTQSIMNQANATYNGIAVFGGTTVLGQAYSPLTSQYVGTATAQTRTIAPGVNLAASVVGSAVFGNGAGVNNFFWFLTNQLIPDIQNIVAGAPGAVDQVQRVDQQTLDNLVSTITSQSATIGASFQAMQAAASAANNTKTVLNNQLSTNIDTDVAKATTSLQLQETTYQSALWAAGQVNKMTLLDFVA